ncbi:MAG: response regulator, partial [Bacteroidota bacterium]
HFKAEEKIKAFRDSETLANYSHPVVAKMETKPIEKPATKSRKNLPLILLVEDNEDIRTYVKESLEEQYRIIEAIDGQKGLEKALKEIPDLIIADISMPEMDGIEMCYQVKSDIKTSHIPVILLTARTSLIFKIDGMEKGADDYITKPFNMQILETRIKNLIESRALLKKKFATNFNLSPSGVVMNSMDEEFLSKVKSTIENNIDNSDFNVDQLASELFMSRMQLYRKLKALTGQSPLHTIVEIRLQRAVQLLKTKQYNISEITYMVGYSDLKSFRNQFKKKFGMSPREYNAKEMPTKEESL